MALSQTVMCKSGHLKSKSESTPFDIPGRPEVATGLPYSCGIMFNVKGVYSDLDSGSCQKGWIWIQMQGAWIRTSLIHPQWAYRL